MKFPSDVALLHFDNFYGNVYENEWKSIRLGLLSKHKYCAIVNTFSDFESSEIELRQQGAVELKNYYERHWRKYEKHRRKQELLREKKKKKAEMLAKEAGVDVSKINPETIEVSDVSDRDLESGFTTKTEAEDFVEMFSDNQGLAGFKNAASVQINLNDYVPATEFKYREEVISNTSYFQFYQPDVDLPINYITEEKLNFPETLRLFTFGRGDVAEFETPRMDKKINVFNYYLMNGASLLPVLALGVKPKEIVGDFCAAPGGKSLAILMTFYPSYLQCNDYASSSRMTRLKNVLKSYIPEISTIKETLHITNENAKIIRRPNFFDKILVDVPCTNDRISVENNENNIFSIGRSQERLKLPQDQMEMLFSALQSVKVGGSVVYSTCTLSPIQNDGVVHMTLKKVWEETNLEFSVCDLKEAFRPLRGLFMFYTKFKYGTQILPFVPTNFGPLYISKLTRVK